MLPLFVLGTCLSTSASADSLDASTLDALHQALDDLEKEAEEMHAADRKTCEERASRGGVDPLCDVLVAQQPALWARVHAAREELRLLEENLEGGKDKDPVGGVRKWLEGVEELLKRELEEKSDDASDLQHDLARAAAAYQRAQKAAGAAGSRQEDDCTKRNSKG